MNPGADADGVVRAARRGDARPIAAIHVATWRGAYAAGFADASLWVLSGNHPARGFYESQGWHRDGAGHEWTPSEGVSVPEVRYVRSLVR